MSRGSAEAANSVTSPRLRGEHRRPPAAVLGSKDADASHRLWSEVRRVRGTLRTLERWDRAPHPIPLPAKAGRGRKPRPSHWLRGNAAMRWITASFALLLALGTSASAEPIEDFYKGKTINWILSAGAGGGYSSYAHVLAPYLSAHIPGKPNIVVQNMPGAGGIRAMIFLSNVAPKDGTTIGMVHSSVPYAPLYGIRGA